MRHQKRTKDIVLFVIITFSIVSLSQLAIEPREDDGVASNANGGTDYPLNVDLHDVAPWKSIASISDVDMDGISDALERKMDGLDVNAPVQRALLTGSELIQSLEGKASILDKREFTADKVPVVASFPDGDISSIISTFTNQGGQVKSWYDVAINGFAGTISATGLEAFCSILRDNDVPFLVEEDGVVQAQLYYASRNMNLRPLAWSTYGFRGDPSTAVAVIDTGIDDSHAVFSPGYSSGNGAYKMTGWSDQVSGVTSPYDDNGHGSHCSGIVAGSGNYSVDGSGRAVATYGMGENYAGYYIPSQTITITAARFNVTTPGTVDIECSFTDSTSGDRVYIRAYLYRGEAVVDSYVSTAASWTDTLTITATTATLGDYSLRLETQFYGADGNCDNPAWRFRGIVHWPFSAPALGSDNRWQGVAPDSRLVGIKVLSGSGSGALSDIVDGINWAITNRLLYNITVISMSLGGSGGQTSMINAANNAVNSGIVTVVAAGNDGSGGDVIGSPGDADNVITVAAMSDADRVTDFSSQGGDSYTGYTTKPDIMAPGGSYYNFSMFSVDTNDNDAQTYMTEGFTNDMAPMQGTSMATPAVAGAANLVIDALGGRQNWNYTASEARLVKALLLMTATGTYPLQREVDVSYSPLLNRGGKDVHEGYGRINVDAAIEAIINQVNVRGSISSILTSSPVSAISKHAMACHVHLTASTPYTIALDVPSGADFDVYVYSGSASTYGEPVLSASGVSAVVGQDEVFTFTPSTSGIYYVVVKAISGTGNATFTYAGNDYAPTLTSPSVTPASGTQATPFNFSVLYTDLDENSPSYVRVTVNSQVIQLSKIDPFDNNYSNGCWYSTLLYLQPATYVYSFSCYDGRWTTSTSTFSGPTVTSGPNNNAPMLVNATVSPLSGTNTTTFTFRATYQDSDNNLPTSMTVTINASTYTMNALDTLDTNVVDGKAYVYSTTLPMGLYRFRCNCSDGTFQNGTSWIDGPEANPFNNIKANTTVFQDDFESGTSKWTTISGLWHLTSSASTWPNPYHSPTHSLWYGQESTGNYNTGSRTYGDLISTTFSLASCSKAYLDYYYWLTGEQGGYDYGFVYISTNGGSTWTLLLQTNVNAAPWQHVLLNISAYCGYTNVRIRFYFDSLDSISNAYRGWLVDDVKVTASASGNTLALIQPANASTFFNGDVDFSWTSISPPFGPIAYHWQTSNTSTFSTITDEVWGIPETSTSTGITRTLNVSTSVCYWRVQPVYSVFKGNWSSSNYFTLIHNDLAPGLANGSVSPGTGNQFTTFTFNVTYVDLDNNDPTSIDVYINGTAYSMFKQNSSDLDYTDGCVYIYQTSLPHVSTTYEYYFNCSDGLFSNTTGTYSGPTVTESNTNSPGLFNAQVSPFQGTNTTVFNFTVTYLDLDNNLPMNITTTINSSIYSMLAANPLDTNVIDGKLYYFTTTLSWGLYQFMVNCSDGLFQNATGWVYSPIANPFESLSSTSMSLLAPVNGSAFFNGNVSFSWSSLSPPFNPITYHLQVSNSSTFSTIVDEQLNITEMPGNTSILWNLDLPTNNYYWRVRPVFSVFQGNWTSYNYFTCIQNKYTPTLNESALSPATGNQLTSFNFTATYTDADDNPPAWIYVLINSTAYPMSKLNATDMNYMDGVVYQYSTILPPGAYEYEFVCGDGRFNASIALAAGPTVTEVNYNPPALSAGQVSPASGPNGTTAFTFSVVYTDADNNYPGDVNVSINWWTFPMAKQNPADTNYMDGCVYTYSMTLDANWYYEYWFNCTDRTYSAALGPFQGPSVLFPSNWTRYWRGASQDYAYGTCTDGTYVYTVGQTASAGAGGYDIQLIKWDQSGNVIWYRTWGGTGTEYGNAIWSDGNALYAVGYTSSYGAGNYDLVLVKWDMAGTFQWYRTWGTTYSDYGYGVTGDGTYVYATGTAGASSYNNVVIVAWDASGTSQWYQTWGGSYYEYGYDVYASGSYVYVSGYTSSYGAGGYDMFLACWTISGSYQWYRTWGGTGTEFCFGISSDSSYLYIVGFTSSYGAGNYDIALVKWDMAGTFQWYRTWGGSNYEYAYDVLVNGTQVFIAGFTNSYGAGLNDLLLVEFTSAGTFVKYNTWGTTLSEYGQGCCSIGSSLFITGYQSNSTVDVILGKCADDAAGGITPQAPASGSTMYCGDVTYGWSGIQFSLGMVNYTWQLGTSTSFTTIVGTFACIGSLPNVSAFYFTNVSTGTYYWRVAPVYGKYTGKWTSGTPINLIRNFYSPVLSNGSASPPTGNQLTVFNFTATYTDADDNPPAWINVLINGTAHPMSKLNAADMDYTDGVVYQYSTILTPDFYGYEFACGDGRFNATTGPGGNLTVIEVNYNPPVLSAGQVSPATGNNGTTLFTFSVVYTDADNNYPGDVNVSINWWTFPMAKQNPADTNYMDGCVYTYSMTLDANWYYEYWFNCTDRTYSAALGPFQGPSVLFPSNWTRYWRGASQDYAYATCTDGTYVYAVGRTASAGAGGYDILLVKWDQSGNEIWYRTWGGTSTEYGYAIWTDGSYLYVVGYTNSYGAGSYDLVLVKWDTGGTFQWYRTWGTTYSDYGYGVTGDGTYVYATGRAGTSSGYTDLVLVKWDASGTQQWYQTWGGSSYEYGRDVYVSGSYVYISGETNSYGAGSYDLFLACWTTGGTYQWYRTWGTTYSDYGYGVTGDGTYVYATGRAGTSSGYTDLVLVKWDASGTQQWYQTWGGSYYEYGYDITVSGTQIFIAGYTSSYGAGAEDFLLAEFTTAGTFVKYNTWGTALSEYGQSCCSIGSTRFIAGYQYNSTYDVMLVKCIAGISSSSMQLVAPPSGATFFCGNITFTWSSLTFSLGLVNYTWQLSSNPTFSAIIANETGILGSPGTTSGIISVNCTSGMYYWRIAPAYGRFTGKYTVPNVLNLIRNFVPPRLTGASVTPASGNQITNFTFQVVYMDTENNAPLYVLVNINGSDRVMDKLVTGDVNYVDGCTYTYTTSLTPGSNPFSFSCSDGKFTNSTSTYPGPTVILANIYVPILASQQVTPSTGTVTTTFTFSVTYYDGDDNQPSFVRIIIDALLYSMAKQTSADTNYLDGCVYIYSTTLPVGTHSYRFMASDGNFSVSFGPFGGPVVTSTSGIPSDWGNCRLDGVRIGAVITHGELNPRTRYQTIATALQQRGATLTDISLTITTAILANYDILWIDGQGSSISTPELDAIVAWVNNGGRFLLTDDYLGGSAASLLGRYNIYYTSSSYSGIYASYIYSHPITSGGVTSLYFNYPTAYINIGSQPSAYVCARYSTTYNLIVCMNASVNGRFAVITDEDFLIYYNYGYNYRLINNTFGWLGYRNAGSGNAPTLTSAYVNPSTGNQYTSFQFRVTYTDAENNAPAAVNVVINGTSHPMAKLVSSDTTYSDGCVYVYSTTLSPGTYEYYFVGSDGASSTATGIYGGLIVTFTANNPPSLSSPYVSPSSGSVFTSFTFSVTYADTGNEFPIYIRVLIDGIPLNMSKHNPADNVYTDGCIYDYTTVLPAGAHNFSFICSDGYHVVGSSVFLGLLVEPAVVVINNVPVLYLGQVIFDTRSSPVLCTFRVVYQDTDNDAPSYVQVSVDGVQYDMNKEVSTDADYTDGCSYSRSITLASGTHTYSYSTSDSHIQVATPTSSTTVPESEAGSSDTWIPWLIAIVGIGLAVAFAAIAITSHNKVKNATIQPSQTRPVPSLPASRPTTAPPPPVDPTGGYHPSTDIPFFEDEINAVISGKAKQTATGTANLPRASGMTGPQQQAAKVKTTIDDINRSLRPLVSPSAARPGSTSARPTVPAPRSAMALDSPTPIPAPAPSAIDKINPTVFSDPGASPKRIDSKRWTSELPATEKLPASITVEPLVGAVPIILDTEATKEFFKDVEPVVVNGLEIDLVADIRASDVSMYKSRWYSGSTDEMMVDVIHERILPRRDVLGTTLPLKKLLSIVRAMTYIIRSCDNIEKTQILREMAMKVLISYGAVDTTLPSPHLTEKGLALRVISLELNTEQVKNLLTKDYSVDDVKKTPVVEKKLPVVEKKSPVVEKKLPVVEKKSSAVEVKSSDAEVKSSAAEVKSPAAEVKSPAAEVKSPDDEEKSPERMIEDELPRD